MDPMHAQFTRRYNIPLDHLDFKYIAACSDVKELENIYRVLLSGEEGRYPELEGHCEAKLAQLAPNSRVLRKDQPPLRPANLDQSEWASIASDLDSWVASVSTAASPPPQEPKDEAVAALPPVRAANATISLTQKAAAPAAPAAATAAASTANKRPPMPRSYDEWSRLEKELDKEEQEDANADTQRKKDTTQHAGKKPAAAPATAAKVTPPPPPPPRTQSLPTRLRVDGLSTEERLRLAELEKAKGNEAFKAGDFEEAAVYYSRSVSASPLPAAYNNRAFAYLKLQKYTACVKDCSRVLKSEPDNLKALLRRATAYHRVHRSADARADLRRLLDLEPANSAAATLLAEVDALLAKRGKPAAGAKRMVIEEVGSSEEDEDQQAASGGGGNVNGAPAGPVKAAPTQNLVTKPSEEVKPQVNVESSNDTTATTTTTTTTITTTTTTTATKSQASPEPAKGTTATTKSPQASPEPPKGEQKAKKVKGKQQKVEKAAPPLDEFDAAKEAGNGFFKAGNYTRAIELYNRCTELRPEDTVPFTNRAVCCIKLDRPNDAVYECNMALELEPHKMKAIFRRGVARKMLGFYREALMDLNLAKSFDPLNRQIGGEIAEIEAALRGSAGGRRVLVQEVEDEDEDDDDVGGGAEAEPVPIIRDVGGVVTETCSAAASVPVAVNAAGTDTADLTPDKATDTSDLPTLLPASKPASVTKCAPQVTDKAAPVTDKAAPVSDKAAPVTDKAAPVTDKAAPVTDKAAPVTDKAAPVTDKAAPVTDKAASVTDKAASVTDKAAPVTDKTGPVADKASAPSVNFPEPAANRPSLRPDCTPFEFTQAWVSASRGSRSGADQRAAHADLLQSVEPGRLPRLLSNKLDGPMLQQIVAAVSHCLLDRDARRGAQLLLSLQSADRFQFVTMFLDSRDKAELTATLARLESAGAASSDEVRQLKSAYQLL